MHRYPTRFQKKIHERIQMKIPTEFERSRSYVENTLKQVARAQNFDERIEHVIQLFEHLYNTPILLKNYIQFREVTWLKMNEIEGILLSKMQSLPASLAANSAYDMQMRVRIMHVLDLMELIRMKYW